MNVVTATKCLDQQGVFGIMRQQTKLDLRVIRREQQTTGLSGEGSANLPAYLGADGNVLKVRIGRGQPAGCSPSLIESRMQSASAGIQQCGQRVHIR